MYAHVCVCCKLGVRACLVLVKKHVVQAILHNIGCIDVRGLYILATDYYCIIKEEN